MSLLCKNNLIQLINLLCNNKLYICWQSVVIRAVANY